MDECLPPGSVEHVDDVRAIVQRAGKDLSIEQSLKTYEEVWLSKVFESREHIRHQTSSASHSGEQVRPCTRQPNALFFFFLQHLYSGNAFYIRYFTDSPLVFKNLLIVCRTNLPE